MKNYMQEFVPGQISQIVGEREKEKLPVNQDQ